MYHRFAVCMILLAMALIFADDSLASPYFRVTGMINIPAAYVAQQGIFDAGFHTAICDQKRDELAIRLDFGIFNFAELGFLGLKKGDSDYLIGNAKR